MKLSEMTWPEVEDYIDRRGCIIVPVGSTEQHGPIGLIGTDSYCATAIALQAAVHSGVIVAPTLAYTPAPFNTAFPGTISISEATFESLVGQVLDGLLSQGFGKVFFLNGHGANVAPVRRVMADRPEGATRLRSWWEYPAVQKLRDAHFGSWEGMHATPSEVAITQHGIRVVSSPRADNPPEPITPEFIASHAGDRHGPPDEHRARFPDGRVGSHSALARPEIGKALLDAAAAGLVAELAEFAPLR